jgi:hypothetical protein
MAKILWIDPILEETIAHLGGVRREVVSQANKYGAKASGILATHHHEGDSSITVTRGSKFVDAYVNLEDQPSKSNQQMPRAHIIEFGRAGAKAVAPLQKAFGIKIARRGD